MKILYFLRVIFISFEFLIGLGIIISITHFTAEFEILARNSITNDEFKKFLILLPVTLFGWIVKEARDLAFLESDFSTALVNWPDYVKFKAHIYASLGYSAIFLLISVVPWLTKFSLLTGIGGILFLGGVLGNLWVAGSIYFAQMSMKEIFRIEHEEM